MWGFLVASRCIFLLIRTLLDHRNTATTKKLDFKNSHLTSVGAMVCEEARAAAVALDNAKSEYSNYLWQAQYLGCYWLSTATS